MGVTASGFFWGWWKYLTLLVVMVAQLCEHKIAIVLCTLNRWLYLNYICRLYLNYISTLYIYSFYVCMCMDTHTPMKEIFKKESAQIFLPKVQNRFCMVFPPWSLHTRIRLSPGGHSPASRSKEWSSFPSDPLEQSAGIRRNQKQIGSPKVGAHLSSDIYHFLYNELRDFYL